MAGNFVGEDDAQIVVAGGQGAAAINFDADMADLAALCAMAEPPAKRHCQRSWQLMEKARATKESKALRARNSEQQVKLQHTQDLINEVAAEFPIVAKLAGLPKKAPRMTERRSGMLVRFALSPPVGHQHPCRRTQMRSASVLVDVCSEAQRACMNAMFKPRNNDSDNAHEVVGCGPYRMHVVNWQFDETSQRIRGALAASGTLAGERIAHSRVAVQIMVQSGQMSAFSIDEDAMTQVGKEPWFARPLVLEAQRANDLAEGFMRAFPLPLEDGDAMNELCSQCDILVVSFVLDRASANFCVLQYVWDLISQGAKNLLPFFIPCVAHGVALMKARPKASKDLLAAAHSMCALLRQWRVAEALRGEILFLVKRHLKIKRTPMAEGDIARGRQLIELLYGPTNSAPLSRPCAADSSSRELTQLGHDLFEITRVVSFGDGGDLESLTHHCFVARVSAEEQSRGLRYGDKCCASFDESVAKTAAPMLNVLVHRGWSQAAESRWTHVMAILKRLAVGCACKGIMTLALKNLQATWKVSGSMEMQLLRIIENDQNNFTAKSQLKLLRVCRQLCRPDATWEIAIEITTLSKIDRLLFAVLGDGSKGSRASIESLVKERGSLLADAQEGLLELLVMWDPTDGRWSLFRALSGPFDNVAAAIRARNNILQLLASLHDHYIIPMAEAPFTLLKLGDPDVDKSRQDKIARHFWDMPRHCLSTFSELLRDQCQSTESVKVLGPKVMRAVSEGSEISVDKCERLHATMRADLRSTARAKNTTGTCNRVFCGQVRNSHMDRSGSDPVECPPRPPAANGNGSASSEQAGNPEGVQVGHQAERRRGRRPRLAFQNSKLQSYKKVVSPNQPLSPEQLSRFYAQCAREWDELSEAGQEHWWHMWQSRGTGADQSASDRQCSRGGGREPWAPLWSTGQRVDGRGRDHPVDPMRFCEAYKEAACSKKKCDQFDETLFVEADCRDRMQGVPEIPHKLAGCCSRKKHVCREVLSLERRRALNGLCHRITAWVDTVGADGVRQCDRLLMLRCGKVATAGDDGTEVRRVDKLALLIDARWSPKCQYFVMCDILEDGLTVDAEVAPDYPFDVHLAFGHSPISELYNALHVVLQTACVWRR